MSRKLPLFMLLFAIGLVLYFMLRPRPDYDVEQLERLQSVFNQLVEPIRKGRPGYALPSEEDSARELDYLKALRETLENHAGDCQATSTAAYRLAKAFDDKPNPSVFRDAARVVERRKDQDVLIDLSDQVSRGRRPTSRPVVPLRTEDRIEALRVKTARIQLVQRAADELSALIPVAESFANDCPAECEVLHSALDYFGN